MLAPERHQQILHLLEERGTLRTVDLAEQFQCTDETIRRDLQILAANNQLARVHGGASSLSGRPALQSFTQRSQLEIGRKQAIAKTALELIKPGHTYAFDSSTTALSLVSILPDQPYRIVTNAYAVMNRLIHLDNVDLISTGGRYHAKTQTFVGSDSIDTLRRHNVNTAFISCIGIECQRGVSEGFEEQATFKERLIQYAEETVLLVDSTKFNQSADYFFANLNQISRIITDNGIPAKVAKEFSTAGCELIIAH